MRFEFPLNLIGKSTMAFSTGQSWRVCKSWYTAGSPEEGFRRSLADGLNQSVVSSVAQARSLVEQAFPYWRMSTNTRQRFTAQHIHFSPASHERGCAANILATFVIRWRQICMRGTFDGSYPVRVSAGKRWMWPWNSQWDSETVPQRFLDLRENTTEQEFSI